MESRQIKFRGIDKDGTMRVGHYKSIVGQGSITQRTRDGFEDKPVIFDQHYILVPHLPSESGWRLNDAYIEYQVDKRTVGQFSGLLDKNGVDVYEGDLLREPPLSDWDKTNHNTHEVFFHDNHACSYHIGWQMDRMHCHGAVCGGYTPAFKPANVNKLIVIGNIYQNPELL